MKILVTMCVYSLSLMVYLHCCFTPFPDPVWKGPVSGGGWEADSEADQWLGTGHPVLISAHEQGQQCRGSAAPGYRHYCPTHFKNETRRVRKDQCGWHGDCAAPHCADHS